MLFVFTKIITLRSLIEVMVLDNITFRIRHKDICLREDYRLIACTVFTAVSAQVGTETIYAFYNCIVVFSYCRMVVPYTISTLIEKIPCTCSWGYRARSEERRVGK